MKCYICERYEAEHPVVMPHNGKIIKFEMCEMCRRVSEKYYFAICKNCGTKSWMAADTQTQEGGLKGKRFTVLIVEECLACEGHDFKKA